MTEPFEIGFNYRSKRFKDAAAGLRAFSDNIAGGIDRSGPVLAKEMRKFLSTVANALAERHGNPWPGGTSEKTLSKRSGDLSKSFKKSVRVQGRTVRNVIGQIGSDLKYAATQEYGAVIKAKKAKYLTIPLPAALNSNGTPKKKSARDWDKTFVAMSKNGNLLIFQKRGRDIIPLYVLKKSVKIPARLGMRDTLRLNTPFFVDTAMQAMVKEIMLG